MEQKIKQIQNRKWWIVFSYKHQESQSVWREHADYMIIHIRVKDNVKQNTQLSPVIGEGAHHRMEH